MYCPHRGDRDLGQGQPDNVMKTELLTDQIEENVTSARRRANCRNGTESRLSDNAERCVYVTVTGVEHGSGGYTLL
jgi:hypothetical protein